VEGADGGHVEVGDAVTLGIEPHLAHVFDSSGASIWCGSDHKSHGEE